MYGISGNQLPFDYATENWYNAERSPSSIHVKNTELRRYFFRYLMQKAISVFKWKIPDVWDKDFFLYTLYGMGYIVVLDIPKYGVICQPGALTGYNLYYRPAKVIVTNPLFRATTRTIDKDCAVIKLMPDYSGILDKVGYYADLLALCAESAGMNIVNIKFGTVFGAENQQQAQTFKKMFDKLSTEPAVAVGKKLFDDATGEPRWFPFTQNVKESYVLSDLLSDMRKIETMFATDFGIPNSNTDKRERLITDEVNSNNVETASTCELWLETLRKGMAKANELFNLELAVDWRVNPMEVNENDPVDTASV